jgi:hypothetical protein
MRRSLPTCTSGHRIRAPITFGSTAIGRKFAGAVFGWLDRGRDDRIAYTRTAEIGIATIIAEIDSETATGKVRADARPSGSLGIRSRNEGRPLTYLLKSVLDCCGNLR